MFAVSFKAGFLFQIYTKISKKCIKPSSYIRLTVSCTMLKNSDIYF